MYVCDAGSHRQHALYIWDKATGSLVKMLTGHKGETLLDIVVSGYIHVYHVTSMHEGCIYMYMYNVGLHQTKSLMV